MRNTCPRCPRTLFLTLTTFGLLGVADPRPLAAQEPTVAVGSRVKVITTAPQSETIGRIVRMDASELEIAQAGDSTVVRVSRANMQQLLVSTKHSTNGSRIKGGVLGGVALGIGAAAIWAATYTPTGCESFLTGDPIECAELNNSERLAAGALISVLTVPLGAGLGILLSLGGDRDTWVESRATVQTAVLARGQTGVGVSIRW